MDGLDAGAVVPLGSQQPFPAMCQAQPKLSIVFVMRVRGKFSALLHLVLEKIGCFDHCDHHNKSPAHRGSDGPKTHRAGICSERKGRLLWAASQIFRDFKACSLQLRKLWNSSNTYLRSFGGFVAITQSKAPRVQRETNAELDALRRGGTVSEIFNFRADAAKTRTVYL